MACMKKHRQQKSKKQGENQFNAAYFYAQAYLIFIVSHGVVHYSAACVCVSERLFRNLITNFAPLI